MDDRFFYGPRGGRHRRGVAVGLLVGLLTASGVAVAAWSIRQTGPGFAKAGQLTLPAILDIPSTELVGDLTPGGLGDLSLRVMNPNTVPLRLGALDFGFGSATSDKPGCVGAAWLSLGVDQQTLDQRIAATPPVAPGATATLVVADIIRLDPNAPTECQGARFQIGVGATFVAA